MAMRLTRNEGSWRAEGESAVVSMSNEGKVRKAAELVQTKKPDCSQHPFLTCAARSS